jgi:RimJ/RimL family protein N-acetyltransferase
VDSRDSGACVGVVSLNYPIGVPERELGWLLWDGYEGQGFALEAAIRARAFAFDELGLSTGVSNFAREKFRSLRHAPRIGAAPDMSPDSQVDDETLTYRHNQ